MSDKASKRSMLKIAGDCDQLAVRAALRLSDEAETRSTPRADKVVVLKK